MPRKPRTLKSLAEAQRILAKEKSQKRRRRTNAQLQQELVDRADHPAPDYPSLLQALGLTEAFQTPHFLNDGMTSSPFDPTPDPLIPFIRQVYTPLTSLEFLIESPLFKWWSDQNLKEKKAYQEDRPLFQHLCERWAMPAHRNNEGLPYIDGARLTSPGANGLIYCHVVPIAEQNVFLACVIPLHNFLADIGALQDGSVPMRHLLKEDQRRANDYLRACGAETGLPYIEFTYKNFRLSRPDPSKPYSLDNIETRIEHKAYNVNYDTSKPERERIFSEIHHTLHDYVFHYGPELVQLFHSLKEKGDEGSLATVKPLFNSDNVARFRTAYFGPVEDAAKLFDTSTELLELIGQSSLCAKTAELARRYKQGVPDHFLRLRLRWPNRFWDQACPEELLQKALKEHIRFHQPWRLSKAEAVELIGPELYEWLKTKRKTHKERKELWEGVRLLLTMRTTQWWAKDMEDAMQLTRETAKDVYRLSTMGRDKEIGDLRWRSQWLFDLLFESKQVDWFPDNKGLEDTHYNRTIYQRRLLPKPYLDLWSQSIKALGAYALAGGVQNDWWLLQAIRDCKGKRSIPSQDKWITGEKWLEHKRKDYLAYCISPKGQTRQANTQAREAWEISMRKLSRHCAGEFGAEIYRQEPKAKTWEKGLRILKKMIQPWLDRGEEFPAVPQGDAFFKASDVARSLYDARFLFNRNRTQDLEWEAELRKEQFARFQARQAEALRLHQIREKAREEAEAKVRAAHVAKYGTGKFSDQRLFLIKLDVPNLDERLKEIDRQEAEAKRSGEVA